MADVLELEKQLKCIGCNFRFWGRAELRELANVLLPGEVVHHCINGTYEGGFAMLVATDQRVLLIDKKPMYLTLEDIRFDMIAELDFNHRMLNATMFVCTPNKSLRFTAYNHARLRNFFGFVQHRVMEIRQHYMVQAQQMQQQLPPAGQMAAAPAAPPVQPASQQIQTSLSQSEPASPTVDTQPDSNVSVQDDSPPPHPTHIPIPQSVASPLISAYTRLPLMSRQRRFLGSRAINSPMPSMYYKQQQS